MRGREPSSDLNGEPMIKSMQTRGRLMTRASLAVMAIAACGAVDTASAQDNDIRGRSVFERPRPQYDAAGIDIGGFYLFPALSVSGQYDDNILATENDEEDDYIFITEPSARVLSKWSRHRLQAQAYYRDNRYLDNDEQDTDEYGANVGGRLDITRRAIAEATIGYDRVTTDRADPDEAGREDPEEVDRYGATLGGSYTFNRFAVAVTGRLTDYQFVDESDADRDRTEYQINTRLSYLHSANLSAFVEPYFRTTDYDDEQTGTGFDRDTDVVGAFLGVAYDLTGKLTGDTSIGYFQADYADSRFDETDGIAIRSRTLWNITARTSLRGEIGRDNVVTNDATASSRTRTNIAASAEHELRENLLLGASARYYRDEYEDATPSREDDNYVLGASARYLINRNVNLRADYDFTTRESDVQNDSFDRNRFRIGVVAQF